MAMAKRPKERRIRIPIDFVECTTNDTENASLNDPLVYYRLLDVEDEGTFLYQGRSIKVNLETLVDIDTLGYGHFGNVMLAEVTDGSDTIRMAVKRLNLLPNRNEPNRYSTQTDLRTIRAVGSGINPHVTKFFTAFVDSPKRQLLICMEACETSMEKFYRGMHHLKETQLLDLLLKRMISHIVDALKFLKSENILHRDVKPSNILINQNPVIFKLCDFGICSPLVNSVAPSNTKGTQIYLAPERIDGTLSPKGYGIRSDMWALGLSTFEIATGEHPFDKKDPYTILGMVRIWIPELPSYFSTELQQLVIWLLKEQQADRPATYDDILASPAMRSVPVEITNGEAEMAKKVIEHIARTSENH
jgi:serine/threonine protein kinase